MLEHLGIVSDTLSVAIVGGEQVTSRQVRILKDINPSIRIYNEYGPTEATVGCVVARLELDAPVRIGKPVSHAGIYILDAGALLSPIGVPGEICISGAGVARGYLNNPGLTAEKFVANPYREGERMYKTGDLGRWLPDGNIEFIGRKDDQVKIRGYRIEVGEIEMVLQAHEAVEAAVVIARTGKEGEKELVAYLVSREELQTADLRVWLGKYLPAYLLPSHYVQLESLPLTPNGKVDRKELPDPEGLGMRNGVEYAAPRNVIEEKLVVIWQKILGRDDIGINDNFFDVGGDSIRIMNLSKLASDALEKEISVALLFEFPNIKGLVDYLQKEPVFYEEQSFARDELIDDLNKFNAQ
jgi:acyl carrier protein